MQYYGPHYSQPCIRISGFSIQFRWDVERLFEISEFIARRHHSDWCWQSESGRDRIGIQNAIPNPPWLHTLVAWRLSVRPRTPSSLQLLSEVIFGKPHGMCLNEMRCSRFCHKESKACWIPSRYSDFEHWKWLMLDLSRRRNKRWNDLVNAFAK